MSREQIVRDTAYAIWEAEGKPDNRHDEHWRLAEQRVTASLSGKPVVPTSGSKPAAPSKNATKAAPAKAAAKKKG